MHIGSLWCHWACWYCLVGAHRSAWWWSRCLPEEFWVRSFLSVCLNHWGRVTHICVGNLTIIGSDNGLSPGRRQAIIWINAGILLIGPLGTNFSEILIKIITFIHENVFEKCRLRNGGPQLKESKVTTDYYGIWWSDNTAAIQSEATLVNDRRPLPMILTEKWTVTPDLSSW